MKIYFIPILIVVFAFLAAVPLQAQSESNFFIQSALERTILLGTYTWDIETNSFPTARNIQKIAKHDIWWQQIDGVRQQLISKNGAVFAKVGDKQFEELTLEDLQNLKYLVRAISNSHLNVGAVVAMRTAEGNFAKLRVVGYRALHDFSFKETEILREPWKEGALRKDNRENYHLEIEWVLFTKQNNRSDSSVKF